MKRSTELERLVTEWFAAFSSGDGAWFDRHISHDDVVRLVGTDPVTGRRACASPSS